jgi:hypothetical protein
MRTCYIGVVFIAVLLSAVPALADPIPFDLWEQFGFDSVGTPATGCDPNDPGGPFCIGSFGTPTDFAPAPPWTFSAPGGALLQVTDAFEAGDRFEIFDFGSSLGLTSAPSGSDDCGSDPVVCLATAGVSQGVFSLGTGNHSISITPVSAPSGSGTGFFIVSQSEAVPEPGSWALLASSALALLAVRRGRRR